MEWLSQRQRKGKRLSRPERPLPAAGAGTGEQASGGLLRSFRRGPRLRTLGPCDFPLVCLQPLLSADEARTLRRANT